MAASQAFGRLWEIVAMPVQPHACERLSAWLDPFRSCLTEPTFRHAVVLVMGAILAPGRRTIAAMLTVVGLAQTRTFTNYHRVLNRNQWSSREVARRLLGLLVATFVPVGPVIIGLDDTLERRWGARIKARGIYRDPVRSSHGHFVKASGLRWLSVMVLAPIPWAGRVWALPFLTVLAPSERFSREHRHRHKALTDWARQVLLQVARWLPGRYIVAVTDQSYAAIDLLNDVREHICMITRLRLDARLFKPPPARRPGTRGRPRMVGQRLPSLAKRLADPRTAWQRVRVAGWYGGGERLIEFVSGTAIWHHPGKHVAIRYVLVRDGAGIRKPQAFLCTDLQADPLDILRWFVRRWSTEVTFAEARRHLGVETQRQWSDKAIARTTPALLGLFSLVSLWTDDPAIRRLARPRCAAWYDKGTLTFSDTLAAVRRSLWAAALSDASRQCRDMRKAQTDVLKRLTAVLCYPA
jgi:DDE superfamily endonuclease